MRKGIFSSFAAITLVLSVLFSQVGVGLLHAHQGTPKSHEVQLKSCPDNGTTPCKACALEGSIVLAAEIHVWALPEFSAPDFIESIAGGVLLPSAGQVSGRAPPVC